MIIIKGIILIFIFILATSLGLAISNKYRGRTKDLKLIRNILNILETKIKYTYEPLPQIFYDISKEFSNNIGEIFKIAKEKMKEKSARRSMALCNRKF